MKGRDHLECVCAEGKGRERNRRFGGGREGSNSIECVPTEKRRR